MNQSNDMTRMLGLEVSYYLGHEGNKFYGMNKSNVFRFIETCITDFF